MAYEKQLAIVVNWRCIKNGPSGKAFFDFRSFVRRYWQLLSLYSLLVSEDTERILLEVASEIRTLTGLEVHFNIKVLGNSRVTLSNIANREQGEIERILLFLDPKGLLLQLETVPFRLISARNHRIHLNFGAALWAEQEWRIKTSFVQPYSEIRPAGRLVLVQENSEALMFGLIIAHFGAIRSFLQIEATATVRAMLEIVHRKSLIRETLNLAQPNHDPCGELLGIANSIGAVSYNPCGLRMHPTQGARFHVIAFADYPVKHAPGIEMQKFFEVCTDPRLRVNLLLNKPTADEWFQQFEFPTDAGSAGAAS